MANGELKFTVRDNTGEVGPVEIHTGAVTAVSLPDLLTEIGALRTAIDGVSIGVMATESLKVFETKLSALKASSQLAQKGVKWLCGYVDNTAFFDDPVNAIPNAGYQKVFTFTIPCADLTLLPSGEEELNLVAGAGLAFKTAFDATARSPYGGRVLLQYMKYVD
jgi:hypothetical protein